MLTNNPIYYVLYLCLFAIFLSPRETNSMEKDLKPTSEVASKLTEIQAIYENGEYHFSHPDARNGDPRQINRALYDFLCAASHGHILAMYKAAYIYDFFLNIPENAFPLYKLAADLGNLESQSCVGFMYFHGRGVDQNIEEAFRYTHRAANRGFVSAQVQLGLAYQYYLGDNKNLCMAVGYYYKALQNQWTNNLVNKCKSDEVENLFNGLLIFNDTLDQSSVLQGNRMTAEFAFLETIFSCSDALLEGLRRKVSFYAKRGYDKEEHERPNHFNRLTKNYLDLIETIEKIVPLIPKIAYGGLVPGFALRCVQPTSDLLGEFYQSSTLKGGSEYDNMGFYVLQFGDQVYSCMGGNNPQMGYDLDHALKRMVNRMDEIGAVFQDLQKPDAFNELNTGSLKKRTMIVKNEKKDFTLMRDFTRQLHENLWRLIDITSPIRDEEFIQNNLPLFYTISVFY